MGSLRKNITTLIIVAVTIILAGIALFTALRLYQSRQTSVAPNVPSSQPGAATAGQCLLSFTVAGVNITPTPTAPAITTPTATPTPTPTPTATATPAPNCGTSCTTNSDCPASMVCSGGACRNPSCTTSTNCICAVATITPTPIPTATTVAAVTTTPPATAKPALPNAGVGTPTIIAIATGILLILGALILVF